MNSNKFNISVVFLERTHAQLAVQTAINDYLSPFLTRRGFTISIKKDLRLNFFGFAQWYMESLSKAIEMGIENENKQAELMATTFFEHYRLFNIRIEEFKAAREVNYEAFFNSRPTSN